MDKTKQAVFVMLLSDITFRSVCMKNIFYYKTELGNTAIEDNGKAITGLYLNLESDIENTRIYETPLIKEASRQLFEYLTGKRKIFDLPLAAQGTEFQQAVWDALQLIPYGETRSYKDIAAEVGNPKACRAVGMANNRNNIAIIIPCHRVIGANGKLIGYGGGLDKKAYLLELEKHYANI
jgi:methylated-DNA-[protein]-cysteine S-methyltransferase